MNKIPTYDELENIIHHTKSISNNFEVRGKNITFRKEIEVEIKSIIKKHQNEVNKCLYGHINNCEFLNNVKSYILVC